jgi:hypothetical protein
LPTDHEAILRVGDGWAAPADIFDKVAAMLAPTRQNDRAAIIAALCDLVPEYRPADLEAREPARE